MAIVSVGIPSPNQSTGTGDRGLEDIDLTCTDIRGGSA